MLSSSKTKKPNSFTGGKTNQSKAFQVETEKDIGHNELEELALTICSVNISNGMIDVDWKTRLSNIQKFSQIIDGIETLTVSSQVLIRLLNKKPGIADSNIQVQQLKLECLKKVIEKFPISSTSMDCCIRDISSLLGSNRNSKLVCEVLTSLAEATTLDLVAKAVLEFSFSAQKSPKVQIGALNWFLSAILKLGFVFEPTTVMKNVKKALNTSKLPVRMAVISLLGVMYLYMGPQLNLFLENEKPLLVQQINAEFAKYKDRVPQIPIPEMKYKEPTKSLKDTNDSEKLNLKINSQSIEQRVDITSQITDALINDLSNKDWNVRSIALNKLQSIIIEAKFITSNLGQVQKPLQDRLSDSNTRLCSNTIHVLELISIAMGPSFKIHIKCYLLGVLNALGDLKTFKSQSAWQCMNTWADVCGYREFFGNDIILNALKKNSVTLRSQLWTWLAEILPVVPLKTIPTDELKHLLPSLYHSFEDRNCKVREASEKVVLGFMTHLGYDSMHAACEKLKPLSVKFCREKLDKVLPNLPTISHEKLEEKKVVKSDSSVKLKQPKVAPAEDVTKINHENASSSLSLVSGYIDNKSLFKKNNLKQQRCLRIPEKNTDLLNEKLRIVTMNLITSNATIQPTIKRSLSLVQEVFDTEDADHSDSENCNNVSNVLEKSNHEQNPKTCSDKLLQRKLDCEVIINKPRLTRFSLDENLIRELDAEVIKRPKLSLIPYKWTPEIGETNFKKIIQMKPQYLVDNLLPKSYDVNPNYNTAKISIHLATSPFRVDRIEQLINELTSLNSNVSKSAMANLEKILLKPNMRSKFVETGKVLPLYCAIIKQFDIFESRDIVGYKMLLRLCLNMSKYQEFMLALNGEIVRDLLSKLLHFLSMKASQNNKYIIGKWVNSLIMGILELSDHTVVTCTLLTMIHDTVKYPETSTCFYKELLLKCLWKVVKSFQKWNSELNYDLVLVNVHKFLEEFDLKYWRKQPSDTPLKTLMTLLYTLVKLHRDKILESLSRSQLPDDSEMVLYLRKLLKRMNNIQS